MIQFKEVPMPTSVSTAVESLITHDKQTCAMVFTDSIYNDITCTNDADPEGDGDA